MRAIAPRCHAKRLARYPGSNGSMEVWKKICALMQVSCNRKLRAEKGCVLMQVSCNRKHSSIHAKKTNMHEVCIYTKYTFNPAFICSFHLACNPCQKIAIPDLFAFNPTKHACRAISKKNNIIQKRYK